MFKKKVLFAAALIATAMSTTAFAGDWDIHGYAKTGMMLDNELESVGSTGWDGLFRENNHFNATTVKVPANQFEITGNRYFTSDNGAEGTLGFRVEYGNDSPGASYFYSSSGGEQGTNNFFELKEAFVELQKLDFLPESHKVWAGRKYYGRDSTALSVEFWKQSSGVGFGYDAGSFAIAVVGADLDKSASPASRQTALVLDTRIKNFKVPGGNLEFQVNFYSQPNAKDETSNDDAAESGIGYGVTYNIDGFYGMDGWSKAAVAYGTGIGGPAKGLNFGSWVGGGNEDSSSVLATTYGMWNVSDSIQLGTEVALHMGENLYGAEELTRFGASVRPSYKVTDNLRMTAEASFGKEIVEDWSADLTTTSLTIAPVITLSNDFYGRPQIKPFVTMISQSNEDGDWTYEYDEEDSGTFFGVEAEVWF